MKPSIYVTELCDNMVLYVVNAEDVPSRAAISKCTRLDLFMPYKKLSITPLESTMANNVALTGNQKFGCGYIGELGFRFKRYASNTTYTIKLMHPMQGVHHI